MARVVTLLERRADMTSRRWPAWLLVVLVAPTLARADRPDGAGERPSHLPLPDLHLEDLVNPQAAADIRLEGARQRKRFQQDRQDIQALARKLLQDEKLLESLRGRFSREEIEKLLGGVRAGEGLGNDPALQRLLRETLGRQGLDANDRQLIQRWQEKLREQGILEPSGKGGAAGVPPPGMPPPVVPPAPPQPPQRTTRSPTRPPTSPGVDPGTPDWLRHSLDRWVRGVDRWAESPAGRSWRDTFANAARRYSGSSVGGAALAERARGWSRYLPSLGPRARAWLPRFPTPRLPEAHLPRLPRLGRMPSAPGASGLSLADAGKAILLAGAVVLVILAVFRSTGLYERLRRGQGGWRLGPWPVRPQDVATRGQLVRAFEYLAVLSLGPAARTQHHLEVAQALGRQPSFDPDRRRDAARTLARLYEQARYTPEDEPLPDADLERARRELCYLAGVPAA